MITAIQGLRYSDDPTAAFFKDVLVKFADRGAVFAGAADEMGFGRGVLMHVPGAEDMLLYQPHHAIAYELDW